MCNCCGSWHPEDFFTFLEQAADPNQPDCWIDMSDHRHKIYISRPGVSDARHGAIFFMMDHLPEPLPPDSDALFQKAREVSFRKMMAKRESARTQSSSPLDALRRWLRSHSD